MSRNKVLIIDDSKTFLLYISQLLADEIEFETRLIQDSRLALKMAEEFNPDLILTDFEMPHLNGNEICKILKESSILSTIPIMMLTTNNTDEQLIKAIENGADDFLFKSAKKEVVIIKIKSMLRHKKIIEADSQLRQLDAVKALITTSNHEFNNALTISNGFLTKLKRNVSEEDKIFCDKISEMNKRILDVIKKLNELNCIDYETYSEKSKMLKI